MERFVYQGMPSRMVFAWGAFATLPEEVERLGARRARGGRGARREARYDFVLYRR